MLLEGKGQAHCAGAACRTELSFLGKLSNACLALDWPEVVVVPNYRLGRIDGGAMNRRWVLVVLLGVIPAMARAEDEKVRKAREEIEQQMQEMVKQRPMPQVKLNWDGIDKTTFGLDEARFELDDERISYGEIENLQKGAKTLYQGPVSEGDHHLKLNLVLHRTDVSLFSGLRTYKYKVATDIPFPGAKGLSVTLHVGLHVNDKEDDPKKQLSLTSQVKPEMMGTVDDEPMPELAQKTAPPPVVRVEATPAADTPATPVASTATPTPPPLVPADVAPTHSKSSDKPVAVATNDAKAKHSRASKLVDQIKAKLFREKPAPAAAAPTPPEPIKVAQADVPDAGKPAEVAALAAPPAPSVPSAPAKAVPTPNPTSAAGNEGDASGAATLWLVLFAAGGLAVVALGWVTLRRKR
jgi:hypothetical protein